MRGRQEGEQLSALPVERKRVGTGLSLHALHPTHPACVDDIDDTGSAHGDVQMLRRLIQKDDVRGPAQFDFADNLTCRGLDGKEHAGIARAEKSSRFGIEVEPMGACRWDIDLGGDGAGIGCCNRHDL